jgi:hypothetical protein
MATYLALFGTGDDAFTERNSDQEVPPYRRQAHMMEYLYS